MAHSAAVELDRVACCEVAGSRCRTRFAALRAWATKTTGRAVRLVDVRGEERGRAPFHAQPVGYDGRSFWIAFDHGCDTEKLLHEVCHWTCAPRARRNKPNYGLGPGNREVDDVTGDNEEVTVMLLEHALAPVFGLPAERIARPDYNVVSRRNVDWDGCEARVAALLRQTPSLVSLVREASLDRAAS